MNQLGVALHNYHQVNGAFPPAAVRDIDGKPLLSWRVLLLPYIEGDALFHHFHLDEPWDSPHNIALIQAMPKIYSSKGEPTPDPHHTFFQVVVGPGAAFEGCEGLKLGDAFPDGSANTILVLEAGEAVPWTKPVDVTYDPNAPLPPLGGIFRGGTLWSGWNKWDGFQAVMASGDVRAFPRKSTSEEAIRARITRDGKEPLTD